MIFYFYFLYVFKFSLPQFQTLNYYELSQKLSPALCSPLTGGAHGRHHLFLTLLLQVAKIFQKSAPAFQSASGLISPPFGRGDWDAVWKHGTGICCVGLLHCPVIHASTRASLWSFLVVLFQFGVHGWSQNLIFQPIVEVSYRNYMWPWFLGLVYESVRSEMPRNENKRWQWLLIAPQGTLSV